MSDMSIPQVRSRREAGAAATRAQIVTTAARLFREHGYVASTIELIASEAGVAVQTIYNSLGGKPALLEAVFDHTCAGPAAPGLVPQFMAARARAAVDAPAVVALIADWFVDVHARMSWMWRVLDDASAVDATVAAFARRRAHERLEHYGEAADELARRGALPDGLLREEAAAAIWSIGHPQVYRTLVEELGWPVDRYRRWALDSLTRGLLAPATDPFGPGAAAPAPQS